MKKHLGIFIILIGFLAFPVLAQAEQYTCPMHPHYVADRPGTCPICGMDLVELETEGEVQEEASESDEDQSGPKRTSVTIDPEIQEFVRKRRKWPVLEHWCEVMVMSQKIFAFKMIYLHVWKGGLLI